MTSITYGSLGTLMYDYDADGRRTGVSGSFARTGIPAQGSMTYNADNSLVTLNSVGVTNDKGGNITCIGSSGCPQFAYDAMGHLSQVPFNGATLGYVYDDFGRRSLLIDGSVYPPTFKYFLYDGVNQVASWVNSSPISDFNTYLDGLGLDETFLNNSTNESFLRDALGSTVALTDSNRAVLDQYTYDPYGNTTDSLGISANPFMYIGREADASGLYYMRASYYSPGIARFMSRDPIGLAGGINMYAYAGDDPIDFSDPTGLDLDSTLEGGGDTCGECFHAGPGLLVPKAMPIVNQNGLDGDVVPFYDAARTAGG